jgi:hypothetical protein
MNDQLKEMKSSGQQTDQLIDLYGQQLTELRKQAADTHTLADAAQVSAETARKSLSETGRDSVPTLPWKILDSIPQ